MRVRPGLQAVKRAAAAWLVMACLATARGEEAGHPSRLDPQAEAQYQHAIDLNRSGAGSAALAVLERLRTQHPGVLRLHYDVIAIASTSGAHAQALRVWADLPAEARQQAPDYVRQSVLQSAIEEDHLETAEVAAAELAARAPRNEDHRNRLIQIELWRGRTAHALGVANQWLAAFPQSRSAADARARVLASAGGHSGAVIELESRTGFGTDAGVMARNWEISSRVLAPAIPTLGTFRLLAPTEI